MKKIIQRLIVFFIGLPALLSVVVFFPQYNHLLLNLVIITFSVLGALEFRNILNHKNQFISLPETIILGALSPAAWTLVISFGVTERLVSGVFVFGALWLLVSHVFSGKEKLDSSIGRATAGFAVMIYPGLFMAWIIRMAAFPEASVIILIFFLIALLNDAAAWCTGILFGANNRGVIAASPSKSVAGFIGGLAASVGTGMLGVVFFPDAFNSTVMPQLAAGALLGLGAGIAATLGDLGESVLKRSAGVKDSGTLILGRGGALDSIDSLAAAAPVFYLLYQAFF